MMYVTKRVPAADIAAGDRINGFLAVDVEHVGINPTGHVRVGWGVTERADGMFTYGGFVTLDRLVADAVPCPDCGDPMSSKRTDERALAVTKGVCSECMAYPRRLAETVERERRVAAYGEGRC